MDDKLTLIFETSTPHASIATAATDGGLKQREFTSDRSHNAVLFSPLKELLDARGKLQIGRVIVGSGPGSYSGTRVGIAAAQGVAIASGCPAVALPSILGVPSTQDGGYCLAIGDARRGSFWTAHVTDLRMTADPELTDAAGLEKIIRAAVRDGVAIFSFEDPSRFPLAEELRQQVKLEFPNATRLWHAWQTADETTQRRWLTEIPQPIYLKPPHITPAKRSWLVQP
jgi:tRNA threonylcarbamoyl adenosine modification protein YeaZ